MDYTLFVDESGQSGIKKIRSEASGGASQYMTFGACLVPNQSRREVELVLERLCEEFGKPSIHCSNLNHNQLVHAATTLSKQKILAFGVLSRKDTLGTYKDEIASSHSHYYNKCAQYLLEKVGKFLEEKSITSSQVSIVFEEGNFNYSALRRLISACRRNPIRPETEFLKNIEPFSISTKQKADEKLLELGDFVAHALFKCVDQSKANFGVTESRYVQEFKSRFYCNKDDKKIVGFGIKPVHSLSEIKLEPRIKKFFEELKAE